MTQTNNKNNLLEEPDLGTFIAQTTATDKWQVLSYKAPILPIHAALLRTGKIFFFCGSGNDPARLNTPYDSVVWDVNKGTFTHQAPPLDSNNQPIDLFCAGHSFRSEGLLMVAGGTLRYDPFYGSPSALLFDPITEKWVKIPSMNNGRWYPTVLTLGSGRIFALSGPDKDGKLNRQPEIYSVTFSNGWNAFPITSPFPAYAQLFLLSSGKIFYSGAQMGNSGVAPTILTLPDTFTQSIAEKVVPGLQNPDFGNQGASVLLPPAQDQKVMIIGGGNSTTATNRVNIVDLKATNPTYVAAKSLNYARMHHSAVLLPDRTVFVCNGSKMSEDTTQSMLPAEIYNPATNTWTVVAKQSVPRVYHSVALLLPDGRVVAAGGNPQRTVNELRLEIYSPAYMSRSRPIIQSAPQTLSYGLQFTIQTPQAGNIKWVSLIRPMATTHSCDTEQRIVDVPINSRNSTSLNVTVTNNRNIAPPGWYMLFISDSNGTPSVATWTRIF
ncbi:galactose oxidase-like domain-containing protein [Nostoc punctiforme]|uniref:Kelch repeat-containing protein n=1 Tax=Nostoc punctiforme (strain ATCC 29133 / PCC 73102) TaxID=63737 RepID=B2IUG1_NOSP7|nr:galactose oxidase-like domain-containing protein [Nostoc punctiforme]ACC81267.1 Kelch repeat-containing protein [Nostoc punctiforme PCC 73102]